MLRWKVPAYRLLTRLVCMLPMGLCYGGARLVGLLLAWLPGSRRSAVRANISAAHGLPADDRLVRRDARRALQHAQLNWVDLLRMGRADTAERVRRIAVPDLRPLTEALAAGKGMILVSAHVGNFDTLGQLLGVLKIRNLVPVEPVRPPELLRFVQRQREALGVQIEPLGPDTFKHLTSTLRANGVVVIMCDRDIQGTGTVVPFFGRPVSLPPAAVLLAWRTGAPIVGAFGYRHADGGIGGRMTPPLRLTKPRRRDRDAGSEAAGAHGVRGELESALSQVAALLEREIRRDPGQWVVQQPIFHRVGM